MSDVRQAAVRWTIRSETSQPGMGRSGFASRFVIARHVVEIFFPQRPELGLEQSEYSPTVIDKIVSANAEHKSAAKAKKMLLEAGRSFRHGTHHP